MEGRDGMLSVSGVEFRHLSSSDSDVGAVSEPTKREREREGERVKNI